MKSWLTRAFGFNDFQGAFADATTKATILLLVSWLTVILLRRQSAAVRHRVWALSIYILIAMPFLSWLVPGWPEPKRRLVLLHEFAHIVRFDAGVQLAGRPGLK